MAINNINGVIGALANGQKKDFFKASLNGTAAGAYVSLWKAVGYPTAGANPGVATGLVPTSSTTGAFPFTTSNQSYIMQFSESSFNSHKLWLYDRLWHNSELSGTVTTLTTIGTATALTRPDANGESTELWMEIYTAIGTTASTLNVTYTNSVGTTGRTATCVRIGSTQTVGRMDKLILQAGDTGVRAVEGYFWSNTTGTAGNFGLTIMRRIANVSSTLTGCGINLDFHELGMPPIYDGACLALMVLLSNASTTGDTQGSFVIGQG